MFWLILLEFHLFVQSYCKKCMIWKILTGLTFVTCSLLFTKLITWPWLWVKFGNTTKALVKILNFWILLDWHLLSNPSSTFSENKVYVNLLQYLVHNVVYNVPTLSLESWTIIWFHVSLFTQWIIFYHPMRKP